MRKPIPQITKPNASTVPFAHDYKGINPNEFYESLKNESLEYLSEKYVEINQQSQLMKGIILLRAREKFKSNNEFGNWVKSVETLCSDTTPVRTRYINLAKFFKDRPMDGIVITVAYAISAPQNQDVAEKAYQKAFGQNLSVVEINKFIQQEKVINGTATIIEEPSRIKIENPTTIFRKSLQKVLENKPKELSKEEAIAVLQKCIDDLKVE